MPDAVDARLKLGEAAADVERARRQIDEANDVLRQCVREAREAGIPMTEIANTARISRVTAYEVLKGD